jgi:hypothetical protein
VIPPTVNFKDAPKPSGLKDPKSGKRSPAEGSARIVDTTRAPDLEILCRSLPFQDELERPVDRQAVGTISSTVPSTVAEKRQIPHPGGRRNPVSPWKRAVFLSISS